MIGCLRIMCQGIVGYAKGNRTRTIDKGTNSGHRRRATVHSQGIKGEEG